MASDQSSPITKERPAPDAYTSWPDYWQSLSMSWRTEPEISSERQAYLAMRRTITPDIAQGVFPFKDVEPQLTRADIEWLLVTHESRRMVGPVWWEEEKNKPEEQWRDGLDLRG